MCGRIVQKSRPMDYVERIFSSMTQIFADPAGPRHNAPPGTRPLTMHRLAEGTEAIARLPWGYKRPDSKHLMKKRQAGGRNEAAVLHYQLPDAISPVAT